MEVLLPTGWRARVDSGGAYVLAPDGRTWPVRVQLPQGHLLDAPPEVPGATVARLEAALRARCVVCGRPFAQEVYAEGRRTCGPTCRQALWRRRARRSQAAKRAVRRLLAESGPIPTDPVERDRLRARLTEAVATELREALVSPGGEGPR